MNFPNPFSPKTPKESAPLGKILPFDVRYALQHKEGALNRQDLEALVNNGFENEALYLIAKSLVGNPDQQRAFIGKYINLVLQNSPDKEGQESLRQTLIQELQGAENSSAQGDKLAQLSRQGFDVWKEKFQSLSRELSSDTRDVYLIAHAMLMGLQFFAKDFSERNKKLNIVVPEWLGQENIGYSISFEGGVAKVDWLRVPASEAKMVLVDETQNTGETMKKIQDYFAGNGVSKPDILTMAKTGE
jgi:hypothetical protein